MGSERRPDLATELLLLGHWQRAATVARELLPVLRSQQPVSEARLVNWLNALAGSLLKQGKAAEARPLLEEADKLVRQWPKPTFAAYLTRSLLGEVHAAGQRRAEAEPLLTEGFQGMSKHQVEMVAVRKRRWYLQTAADQLVRFYETSGETDKARQWRLQRDLFGTPPKP